MKDLDDRSIHQKEIQDSLLAIVQQGQAICALLITQDGQHLTSAGDVSFINTTALAALVAGMFSATKEVARLLGETEFSILFQQGQKRNIHISMVAHQVMLIVVFEGIHKTGMIRMQAERQSRTLSSLIQPTTQVSLASVMPVPVSPLPLVSQDSQPQTNHAYSSAPSSLVSAPSAQSQTSENGTSLQSFKEYATSLLDDIFGQTD